MAEKEVALSLPMSLDSGGNLLAAKTEDSIWSDRVKIALGTRLGERVMRPEYGSTIGNNIFSTVSSMEETIDREVQRVFNELFPLLELNNVSFSFDNLTGRLSVSLVYALPNKQEVTTSVGDITISNINPPYEELA
jgi:phage baseplate assembly protein W